MAVREEVEPERKTRCTRDRFFWKVWLHREWLQEPDLLAALWRLLVTCALRFFFGQRPRNGRIERQGETGLGQHRPVGTTEQGIPQGIEPLTEREWLDPLNLLAQIPLPILREHPRGQQTLQGRLGDIIHTLHPGSPWGTCAWSLREG